MACFFAVAQTAAAGKLHKNAGFAVHVTHAQRFDATGDQEMHCKHFLTKMLTMVEKLMQFVKKKQFVRYASIKLMSI